MTGHTTLFHRQMLSTSRSIGPEEKAWVVQVPSTVYFGEERVPSSMMLGLVSSYVVIQLDTETDGSSFKS